VTSRTKVNIRTPHESPRLDCASAAALLALLWDLRIAGQSTLLDVSSRRTERRRTRER
jgi:hypothetical protein